MAIDVTSPLNFLDTPTVNDVAVAISGDELILTQNNTPVTPETNTVRLFGRNLANRMFPAFVGPSGMDVVSQPGMWRQKIAYWNPPGNATTVPGINGMNAPIIVGTATTRAVATTNLFTRTKRIGYVSAAPANNVCGQYSNVAQFTTGNGAGLGGFFYSCRFGFSDAGTIANPRAFVGMSSSIAAPTNVEPSTLLNSIGVAQLSTSTTQLYLVYGGSAAQTAIPLGTNFPPMVAAGATNGIAYDFTLFAPPSGNGVINYRLERIGTSFYVDGVITPTVAGTQTPLSTTLMGPRAWRTNNTTASAAAIDVLGIYIETDY